MMDRKTTATSPDVTPTKRVLVLYYSQTGQLQDIVRSVTRPLEDLPGVEVVYEEIRPATPYPFPWTPVEFCDVFPESVSGISCDLQPLACDPRSRFDLVILAYTVWYLAPSIPVASFLRSVEAEAIFKGRPVVTLIGCRNMWITAQETVKDALFRLGSRMAGNIVLTDRASNLVGVLTIALWMLTGRKKRFWGILPRPGISDHDIREASRFGEEIRDALGRDTKVDQDRLNALGAVTVRPSLMLMEKRISRVFAIWAAVIRKKGGPGDPRRRPRVRLFMAYLILAILLVAPLASLAALVMTAIGKDRIAREIAYHSQNARRADFGRDSD